MTRRVDDEADLGEYYRFVSLLNSLQFRCRAIGCTYSYSCEAGVALTKLERAELHSHARAHDTPQTPESTPAAG